MREGAQNFRGEPRISFAKKMKYLTTFLLFMRNTRFYILVFAICLLCGLSRAKDEVVFVAADSLSPATSAVYNGMRDAFEDMKARFGKTMEVRYVSANGSADKQNLELGSAFTDGARAAVVLPVSGTSIKAKIKELAASGFPVAALGEESPETEAFYCVRTDSKKTLEVLREALSKFTRSGLYPLAVYFKSRESADKISLADLSSHGKSLPPILPADSYKKLLGDYKILNVAAFPFYSGYWKANAIEIARYDNYGILFLGADVLADVIPLSEDHDRRFAVCVGVLPQLDSYLASGQLDLCVYDDYYGWGYFAARALAEKVFEKTEPKERIYEIAPLQASPDKVAEFIKDWRKWLK